jgi:hypothetical protein
VSPGFSVTSTRAGLNAGYTGTEPSPGAATVESYGLTRNVGVQTYGTASGALAPYLTLTVERGTGGSFASCAGFTLESSIYSGLLSAFNTTVTDYASGVGGWAASASPATKTYRITLTLADNNNAQDKTAAGTFTWEAQTTG